MLLILVLASTALAMPFGFGPGFGGFGFGRRLGFPGGPPQPFGMGPPEFLSMVNDQARAEFMNILEDEDIPRKEFKQKVNEWAKKNGVEKEHEKFVKDMDEDKQEAQQQMDKLIKELPEAMTKLRDLLNDDNLTRRQMRKQKHALEDGLSVPTQEALFSLMRMFHPHQSQPPHPFMFRRGFGMGMRRRGFGFHPFGFRSPFFASPDNILFPRNDNVFPPPPFVQNASQDAQEDFEKIMELEDIPRQEVEKKIEEWAQQQGDSMRSAVQDFENDFDEFKKNQSEKIQKALDHLKPAFQKFESLFTDKSLSRKELHKEARQIFDDLTMKEAMIAQHILHVFHPMPRFEMPQPPMFGRGFGGMFGPMGMFPQNSQDDQGSEMEMPNRESHHESSHRHHHQHHRSSGESDEEASPFEPKQDKSREEERRPEENFFFRF